MKENQEVIDRNILSHKEEELSSAFFESMKAFVALWEQEVKKGNFPPSDVMQGLDSDIRIAQVVNACSENSSQE
jgi:hypothetical protein